MTPRIKLIALVAIPALMLFGWALHPLGSWVTDALTCAPPPVCEVCAPTPAYSVRRVGENAAAVCADDRIVAGIKENRIGLASGVCPEEQPAPPAAAVAPAVPGAPATSAHPEVYQPLPRKVAP